jgi:hypothetical protein
MVKRIDLVDGKLTGMEDLIEGSPAILQFFKRIACNDADLTAELLEIYNSGMISYKRAVKKNLSCHLFARLFSQCDRDTDSLREEFAAVLRIAEKYGLSLNEAYLTTLNEGIMPSQFEHRDSTQIYIDAYR